MAMTRRAFSRRMQQLGQLVTDAIGYYAAWVALYDDDPEFTAVMNVYRGHFLPARNALKLVTILQAAKLFDRDPRAISIPNVIRTAERNSSTFVPHLEEATLDEIKRRLVAQARVLRRLTRFRNQRLAHHDTVLRGSQRFTYGEFSHLLEDVKWIWNELDHGHRRNVTAFDALEIDAQRHTAAMIDALRRRRPR